MPFAAIWMEIIILSKSERDKYYVASLIHGILKKWYKLTYLQNQNRLIDLENKHMVTKGEKEEE